MRYIVESAFVTNERLYNRDGGDEPVWIVVDTKDDCVMGVYMTEYQAEARAVRCNGWGG